nr:MobQ family relaxase [Ruminococcus sp. 1001713B170207_170306_F5]
MAIFQFHMQVIKRNDGKSVVAAAAYRSASKIENQYTGIMEDYTKKKWVTHSEIVLPEHAPKKFQDRGYLWNSVEEAEKDRRARLAREVMIALPNELTPEENLQLVQGFVQDAFVSQGMVADFSIHNPPVTNEQHIPVDRNGQPTKDEKDMIFQNPHAHILLTMRPLDKNGNWQPKTQKEYLCKRQGETAAFTAEEFIQAKADGWEKQYPYFKGREKIWLTPSEAYLENLVRASGNPRSTPYGRENPKMKYWNSTDAIFSWRKSWEEHVNQALERAGIPERVDCRSYQAQGLDDIAGIHLGPHGAKQTDSQQYQINEDIKKLNKKNQEIRQALGELEAEIKQKNDQLYESIAERMGWLRGGNPLCPV